MNALNPSRLWRKRLGDAVLNPYIGCEHACYHCYCPAMPGVRCNNGRRAQREWGSYLLPKAGIVEALKRQLVRLTPERIPRTEWGAGWVMLSFLTDCYTPSESRFQLTRQCLQLLLEAGHRVRIQTRSALVERDFDLLVAHRSQIRLGTSLPHLDDRLARVLEPHAAAPSRRLRMLENAASQGIEVYVAVAPFLPFHSTQVLDDVLARVAPLRPAEVFCEVLNPKGENVRMMADALASFAPASAQALRDYTASAWAAFTYKILAHGAKVHPGFIPWPDTAQQWAKYLSPEQTAFLRTYLPQEGPSPA